jgi:hypothetical protein
MANVVVLDIQFPTIDAYTGLQLDATLWICTLGATTSTRSDLAVDIPFPTIEARTGNNLGCEQDTPFPSISSYCGALAGDTIPFPTIVAVASLGQDNVLQTYTPFPTIMASTILSNSGELNETLMFPTPTILASQSTLGSVDCDTMFPAISATCIFNNDSDLDEILMFPEILGLCHSTGRFDTYILEYSRP